MIKGVKTYCKIVYDKDFSYIYKKYMKYMKYV